MVAASSSVVWRLVVVVVVVVVGAECFFVFEDFFRFCNRNYYKFTHNVVGILVQR